MLLNVPLFLGPKEEITNGGVVAGLEKLVYSTCSIHQGENEAVVQKVLAAQNRFILAPRSLVLPTWPRRGWSCPGLSQGTPNYKGFFSLK